MAKKEMTTREAAVEMGTSIPYILLLLYANKLRGEQRRGRWFIPAPEVARYKAEHPRIGERGRGAAAQATA